MIKLKLNNTNLYDITKNPLAHEAYELGKIKQLNQDQSMVVVWRMDNTSAVPESSMKPLCASSAVPLEQIIFLRSLAEDFDRHSHSYLKARSILIDHAEIPNQMNKEVYAIVVEALRNTYKSILFLRQLAYFISSNFVSLDLVYISYFVEIRDFLWEKFSHLIKWCGTGLDLAANYDSHHLARLADKLIEFERGLLAVHARHGADLEAEGDRVLLERFLEREKDFLSYPGLYSLFSELHIEKLVELKEETEGG